MLAKYTEATGGQAAWDQVQTIRVTGSVRLSQPEMVLPFERIMSRAGQQLTRLQINGMNYTDSAYDGDRAWGTNRMMQAELKTEEETENLRRSSTEFPYPAHNWEAKGFSATYLDTIRLNGRLTHRIKLKKTPHIQNGKEQDNISTLYIDANSFLLVRTESEILDGPYQGQLLRANLSDYREVEGRWYPFVSEMAYDDQTFQVLTTEEVFFNESISADHFAFPE
ncbi:MAG: hypothetical protein AAF433_06330 [Bacteroidota bacterium]